MFTKLLSLKPYSIALKTRNEGDFLVTMSIDLEIRYLNQVAKEFYNLSNGFLTIKNIIDILYKEYEVDYNKLSQDILFLVRDLQWSKIINLKK
ncbi:MAG: PqqD family protein [Deltaproteobacteria bacterium]|jgi:hypothetical protein|nr:PqqD family protein [Deltaproteobacteria bacterium]